ncbi:unnamed protein product, partial [Sphacelaria rigidula]
VVAAAKRNGVDPVILEYRDEEIPFSTQYGVVSPCAPLLRVSPDLGSMPIAQLTSSSGIIYTADPSKAFGRAASNATPAVTLVDDKNDALAAAAAAVADVSSVENKETEKKSKKDHCAVDGSDGENGAGKVCSPSSSSVPLVVQPSPPNSSNPASPSNTEDIPTAVSAAAAAAAAAAAEFAAGEVGGYDGTAMSEPCEPGEAHKHPLVLSGRRVWVVSPVVGWASVWAETGQKILKPAADIEAEERAKLAKSGCDKLTEAGVGLGAGGIEPGAGTGAAGQALSDYMLALGFSGKTGGVKGTPEGGGAQGLG